MFGVFERIWKGGGGGGGGGKRKEGMDLCCIKNKSAVREKDPVDAFEDCALVILGEITDVEIKPGIQSRFSWYVGRLA